MERLLTVWIENCNKKRIPHSRAAIRTKALNLFKRAKENTNEVAETFNASVGLTAEVSRRMLQLPVW